MTELLAGQYKKVPFGPFVGPPPPQNHGTSPLWKGPFAEMMMDCGPIFFKNTPAIDFWVSWTSLFFSVRPSQIRLQFLRSSPLFIPLSKWSPSCPANPTISTVRWVWCQPCAALPMASRLLPAWDSGATVEREEGGSTSDALAQSGKCAAGGWNSGGSVSGVHGVADAGLGHCAGQH